MSIQSYERNVALGVAGPHLPVCLPAALEQISADHGYKPGVYSDYEEFVNWWSTLTPSQSLDYTDSYAEMLDKLARPLGGIAFEDLTFKTAATPLGWIRTVGRLLREGSQVTVDIRTNRAKYSCHTVGLVPTSDRSAVRLVSTHVPKSLQGVIPLSRVAERMYVVPQFKADRPYNKYPFETANIMALSPH